MPQHATITDALLALPVGADAIAEHLAGLDIKAVCGAPRMCALAVYLKEVTGAEALVSRIDVYQFMGAGLIAFADLGRTDLGDFVERFDTKTYPQLIAPPAPRPTPASSAGSPVPAGSARSAVSTG